MKKGIAIAFSGPSNSGKTTIIEKVARYFIDIGYKVAIIKHDPKDKARFDKEGKDSYKFTQTGADVAVVSPKKTTIFKQSSLSIKEIADCFKDYDILLVEGLKTLPLPRIGVFRGEINREYLPYLKAIAVDNSIGDDEISSIDLDILNLNNTQEVAKYILENGEEIYGRDI